MIFAALGAGFLFTASSPPFWFIGMGLSAVGIGLMVYRLDGLFTRVEVGIEDGRVNMRSNGMILSSHEEFSSVEDVRLIVRDPRMSGDHTVPLTEDPHRHTTGLVIFHNGTRDFFPTPVAPDIAHWLGKLIIAGAKANGIWQGKDEDGGESS